MLQCIHAKNLNNNKLNKNFLTGFSDAEASFMLNFSKKKGGTGWSIQLNFQIGLHQKDRAILELIKTSFDGVGKIYELTNNSCFYQVRSLKDLAVILAHFEKHKLITKKGADYLLFKQAFELLNRKEHLTIEGLKKLVAIKASMNRGLSDALKAAFPDITPVPRPKVELPKNIEPN